MSFLSKLLAGASQSDASGPANIPYIHLQKYFQLFVPGLYTVKDIPSLQDLSVKVPGQMFKFFHTPHADAFFSEDTGFVTTSQYANHTGGRLYHGEFVTHGEAGGAAEYLYIVISSAKPTPEKDKHSFVPHFLFLGKLISGENQEMVHPLFILSQSGLENGNAFFELTDLKDPSDIVSALAYADLPFRAILSGNKVDADALAQEFSETDMLVRFQKLNFLSLSRTPQFLEMEMQDTPLIPTSTFGVK